MKHLNSRLIQMLLDGEAGKDEALWADRHVHDCIRCRIMLEEAGFNLKTVMQGLGELDPTSIPSPPPFDHQLATAKDREKPLILVLALSPIKVPAFLLVLMAGALVFLICLLSFEKPQQGISVTSRTTEEALGLLTMISAEGETKIGLNAPIHGFRPVKNPSILVLKKEDTYE